MPYPPDDRAAQPPLETATAHVELRVAGDLVRADLTVPTGVVPPHAILPAFWSLTDRILDNAERAAAGRGLEVSCRKGCGACCRQLVPVSEAESRMLRDLVDALPEPRRGAVRARFEDAARRIDEAGLLDDLRNPDRVPLAARRDLGLAYFRLGIACPFLEDESCSIHPVRPLVCREYLVTSPAENCDDPRPDSIERLPVPVRLSGLLARFADESAPPASTWIPLTLAPEWASGHPDASPPRPGPEWLRELFRRWSGALPPPIDG